MDFSDFEPHAGGGVTAEERAVRLGPSLSGTNLERAGDYNQRVVLQVIRRNPDITRTEIATMTNLTAPTIANITGRLFEADLIVDAGRRKGGRGQPAVRLRINPDGCFAIGLNIDRDHVTLVSLDLAGQVRSRFTQQIAFAMPDDIIGIVGKEIAEIRGSGVLRADRILGVGVALPDDLGQVALPHRPAGYECWGAVDLQALLAGVVPWSVHIDNDAAAAAIGEAQFGGGLDHASFFYILVSAGLGGGVVIDGSYYRGADARSGELGFLPLAGMPGQVLQDVVSLSALAARLEQAGLTTPFDPALDVAEQFGATLDAWVDECASALVPALTAVNCLINPAAVLIGGRLPDLVLDRLASETTRKLIAAAPTIPARAPIRRATLSRDAPAVGAAILPFLDRILPSDAILIKG
ncbi:MULTISPECIES: ROK family transcriptional regulator [Sphingomonas]|uniref:MarR family transcriptional regulator n=1 Tax=Sphingomonas aerolata TaxID=185951 RepID=A0A2T4YS74_9SPHN|nr:MULTISPECIES: ROK family transcriptional regulator [Sphingomonas]KQM95078.1 ROK family transcriptional regulator [Sphingomonas sp. Leaf226]MDY0968521.1 ROK family transcriptional regulator [Sphingomonas sp. CFBP9021]PTM46641.1 MarR family transcriptional regulator [Sphingomonas aerolata]USR01648.1 ROK family transcriptional regulator [Sphingomonas aerolata]